MRSPSVGLSVTFRMQRYKSVRTFQTPIYLVNGWRKSKASSVWGQAPLGDNIVAYRTASTSSPLPSQHHHAATAVAPEAYEKLLSLPLIEHITSRNTFSTTYYSTSSCFCSTPTSDMCYFSSASPSDGQQTSYSYRRHITAERRV